MPLKRRLNYSEKEVKVPLLKNVSLSTVKMLNSKKRFHKYHGSNVVLRSGDTEACRNQSYANAVVFSESPLGPNDLFLLEIDETERGWSGDMRIGLTTMNPHDALSTGIPLPQYALPDLNAMRPSWIYAISKSSIFNRRRKPFTGRDLSLSTSFGRVPLRNMLTSRDRCATDVGSQIGVVYVPVNSYLAELHFIVNGVDQGIFASDIPYSSTPLFVVVDVYGCTKKVRVIQLTYNVLPLQEMCREAILTHIKQNGVSMLPLPQALKDYLKDSKMSDREF